MRKISSMFSAMAFILFLFLAYSGISYYYYWPLNGFSDRGNLGAFGDSFGVLTSFFSALACIGVYATWLAQKKANEQAKDDSKKQSEFLHEQRVESNFFQMMNFMQNMISDMDINRSVIGKDKEVKVIVVRSGRDCFSHLFIKVRKQFNNGRGGELPSLNSDNKKEHKSASLDCYNAVYTKFSNDLSNYFRFVYSIFRYLETSGLKKSDINKYAKILRAQLSDGELSFLFYNALSDKGSNFIAFAVDYELFDNLADGSLLHADHVYLMPKKSLGKAADKYDQTLFDD